MTALYVLLITQLVALVVALDVLWREYHPAQTKWVFLELQESLRPVTLFSGPEPTFFHVVHDCGRPRVVWA